MRPHVEPTERERLAVEAAFKAGAQDFARKLEREIAPAETIKADWLLGRLTNAAALTVSAWQVQQQVATAADALWRNEKCVCGHERHRHWRYDRDQPEEHPEGCGVLLSRDPYTHCPCEQFTADQTEGTP